MAKKSVLIIDESALFRDYVANKLEGLDVIVIKATNGVDGANKISAHNPDLIIADYFLTQRSLVSILRTKRSEPSQASIPVVVCTGRLSREKLVELSQLGVRKIFMKPLKIDQLWQAVGEILGTKVPLDDTPCLLDAHVNENVVFVEAALGLNLEKIQLLEFKISELMTIHNLELPKILVMISSLELRENDHAKLRHLFEILVGLTRGRVKWIKVLTQAKGVETVLRGFWEFSEITITDSLEKAMDELLEKPRIEGFVQDSAALEGTSLEMRFDHDKALEELNTKMQNEGGDLRLAVVDDDFIVQEIIKNTFSSSGASVEAYDDGISFLEKLDPELDLVFLDLMMPRMNGFEVLEKLRERGFQNPVIVLSALSRRETVLRAMGYGIRSYITKPVKPDELLRKTYEVVGSHF